MKITINRYTIQIIFILLLVSIPPLIIASAYNANLFLNKSVELIDSKNRNELVRTGVLMENTLRQIKDIVFSFSNDAKYARTKSVVDKSKIMEQLYADKQMNKYFENIMLYNKTEDFVLVSGYGIVQRMENTPFEWIQKEVMDDQMTPYQMKLTETRKQEPNQLKQQPDKSPKYVVSVFVKLPFLDVSQNYMVFNVNVENMYNDFLKQLNIDHDIYSYYLTDDSGKVIFSKNIEEIGSIAVWPQAMAPNKNKVVNSYKLESLNWNLVSEINNSALYHDMYKSRNQMFSMFVFLALLIVGMIMFGSRQLYKPLRRVLARMTNVMSSRTAKQGEFEWIGTVFDKVIQSNDELKLQLSQNEQLLTKTLLLHLIKNRLSHSVDTSAYLADYDQSLVITLWTIPSEAEWLNEEETLQRKLEAALNDRFSVDLFAESPHACIALFRLEQPDLNALIVDLISSFDEEFLAEVTISIGGVYQLDNIHRSYTEALYANNIGRIYTSDTNLFCYNKLPMDYEKSRFSDDATADRLELAIRQQNEKDYIDLLNGMFSDRISVNEYNCNFYHTVSLLIKLFDQDSMMLLQDINGLINDKGIMNVATVKQFFYTHFKKFTADYDSDFNGYAVKIDTYIAGHFAENFSLDDVAEYIGVTKQYICHLFKEHYHKTFIDYLSEYRIEKAKGLLGETRTQISEIGRMVGFNSNSYFAKVFKQYTGITPTEYRTLLWNRERNRQPSLADI
ncbi:helix-turn-helix domain-containing protein [Paenibacillus eucommiae]|uniref:YesN/AraC family two-component response regulator n=1 Tax=Paenibacillus eucommiae TaxID=1355755 RepID=A0ABS4IW28_9BACL|nr:helix-turn-helix domain-containing protein [Paenibacillus eucommiae]MBP1991723.1 YesN/AraC family two-component response regulator [Paenibacillus eucommiae]